MRQFIDTRGTNQQRSSHPNPTPSQPWPALHPALARLPPPPRYPDQPPPRRRPGPSPGWAVTSASQALEAGGTSRQSWRNFWRNYSKREGTFGGECNSLALHSGSPPWSLLYDFAPPPGEGGAGRGAGRAFRCLFPSRPLIWFARSLAVHTSTDYLIKYQKLASCTTTAVHACLPRLRPKCRTTRLGPQVPPKRAARRWGQPRRCMHSSTLYNSILSAVRVATKLAPAFNEYK